MFFKILFPVLDPFQATIYLQVRFIPNINAKIQESGIPK